MLADVYNSYRAALHLRLPLFVAHIFVRLVSLAVLVPLIGFLLATTLSFSQQSALTDQDIARFLFTPAGAIGALVVGSAVIVAAVFDVAFMTAVFRSEQRSAWGSVQAATAFLVRALPRLFTFAGELLLRVLLLAAPFVVIAAIPAALLLREFDINYYLANQPPAFMTVIVIGAFCLLGLALVLLERLSGWAVALHFALFDNEPPRQAFQISRRRMKGHRGALIKRVVAWALIRLFAASLLLSLIGFLLAEVPPLFGSNAQVFFVVIGLLLALWAVVNAAVNAIANGALADMLNDAFDRFLEARPAQSDVPAAHSALRVQALPLGVAVICLGSLLAGGIAFNQIGQAENIEVIGHRGAAASRPENTMASVVKAVEDGADWVEIDVQETADGEVIVVHDSDFMKAAGVPLKVWDATMEDIADIDIGTWFDPAYAAERAPKLSDVLAAVKDRSKLIIELKYYGHDVDLENRVIALVERAGMQDQVATMSLKYPAVQKMLSLRPDWRTGVLAATSVGNLSGLEGNFLAVSAGRISTRLLAQAASTGKDVYVWTVNDPAMMSRMISLGVDGLITDEPARARVVIDYYKSLDTTERFMLRLGNAIGYAFDLTPQVENEI